MIKQSFTFGNFVRDGYTPEQVFRAAREIGYVSVEMLPQEHWPAARDAGLEIAIIGGHGTLTDGLNRRENHDRIERELREKIAVAKENGIPSLICFSGNRNGLSDEDGLAICAAGLGRAIPDAEAAGINLAVELLNSKVNHPDYQCDRTAWGVELCRRVGSPRATLLYDIYHMQIMEGDLIRNLREAAPVIAHYHTAGNPGRQDLDDEQEIHYPGVMRAIAATGYQGYVGHEFRPKGDPIEALRQAFAVCNV
jgi:hydroxypyruvate isomerase